MTQTELNKSNVVSFIADIFERRGAESYLGEEVTMAEHMLQAAWLAEQEDAPYELVAAALLHDIGHYTSEFGAYSPEDKKDKYHDASGAKVLEPYFPPVIIECVRLHVAAKRYLCAKNPNYMVQLSKASIHSLSLQGGPMNEQEVNDFESSPFYEEAILVRKWDDKGKVANMETKSFVEYTDLLQKIVEA
jgi:phosphonate degradation associated HDIG domain protein